MADSTIIGRTVVFTAATAWNTNGNTETAISGLYMVEDTVYPDRSCGQFEPGVLVFPEALAGTDEDGPMYFVDADTFTMQTDPKSYGRSLAQEREFEWLAERSDREYADLFDVAVSGDDTSGPF